MFFYFDSFREEGFPTAHRAIKTAAETDVLEAGFILAFVLLAVCYYLILPALSGKTQLFVFLRVTISLFVGAVLMTSNFGQEWETAHIRETLTAYKAGEAHEIRASVGIKIGLRSVNITLVRVPGTSDRKSLLDNETINYNEQFWWTWDQGRFGFGPFAGHLQQDFRKAQLQGLPLPILWVADYFTIDGEGLRFGRYYRTAGWYTHIAMWSAVPCWLMANFLFLSVIRYGGWLTVLTGLFQILACILWAVIRNPFELVIPFEAGELRTKYAVNYWLTLVTGVLCVVLGIAILILDLRAPSSISFFFGIDPLSDYEEHFLTPSELEEHNNGRKYNDLNAIEMTSGQSSSSMQPDTQQTQSVLIRRTTIKTAQRSLYRTPVNPTFYEEEDDQPLYLNVQSRIPATVPE